MSDQKTEAAAGYGYAGPAACSAVLAEVERYTRKLKTWPIDPPHALAVLGEEYGKLTNGMAQLTYEPHKTSQEEVRKEAVKCAAMALRLVMSLDRNEYRPCVQRSSAQGGDHAKA